MKKISEKTVCILIVCVLFMTSAYLGTSNAGEIRKSNVKRDIYMIVDCSGSMSGERINNLKKAANKFINRCFEQNSDIRIAIYPFSDSTFLYQELTNDQAKLNNYVEHSIYDWAGTNPDSAFKLVEEKLDKEKSENQNLDRNKTIIFFTDGEPNQLESSDVQEIENFNIYESAVIKRADRLRKNHNLVINSIGFFNGMSSYSKERASKFCSRVADGKFFEIENIDAFEPKFEEVADEINQENDNPVIIVPGIMGSRIYSGLKIWEPTIPEGENIFEDAGYKMLSNRILINAVEKIARGDGYVSPTTNLRNESDEKIDYGTNNTYKGIIEYFIKNTKRPVYFFNYDWRKSVSENAQKLYNISKNISAENNNKKIDFIGHSMGGLLMAKLAEIQDAKNTSIIDDYVTVCTPYEGAPKTIYSGSTLRILDKSNDKIENSKYKLLHWALWDHAKDAIRNFRGMTDLLPSRKYMLNNTARSVIVDDISWKQILETNMAIDENLESDSNTFNYMDYVYKFKNTKGEMSLDFLLLFTTEMGLISYENAISSIFGPYSYKESKRFIEGNVGGNIYDKNFRRLIISSNNRITPSSVVFKNNQNTDNIVSDLIVTNHGDGTVPYSSQLMSDVVDNINDKGIYTYHLWGIDHGSAQNDSYAMKAALDFINGGLPEDRTNETKKPPSYFKIYIRCPIKASINKPNGKLDSVADETSLFTFEKKAPYGSIYFLGDNLDEKLMVLENDDYDIKLDAYDDGKFTINIEQYDSDNKLLGRNDFIDFSFKKGQKMSLHVNNIDNKGAVLKTKDSRGKDLEIVAKKGESYIQQDEKTNKVSHSSNHSYKARNLSRISGINRYETAIEISKNTFKNADTVVLASGNNYADALAGNPLASKLKAPILLSQSNQVSSKVLDEINRLGAKNIVLLGGESSLSKNIEKQLSDYSVKRIAGKDRYSTSFKISKEIGSYEKAFLASGENYADALSISPIARKNISPILLVKKNHISDEIKNELKGKDITIIGGENSISSSIESLFSNKNRISGLNRYETCKKVVEKYNNINDEVVLVSGNNYPDALTGAVIAEKKDVPLLLVKKDKIPDVYSMKIIDSMKKITIVGGFDSIGNYIN